MGQETGFPQDLTSPGVVKRCGQGLHGSFSAGGTPSPFLLRLCNSAPEIQNANPCINHSGIVKPEGPIAWSIVVFWHFSAQLKCGSSKQCGAHSWKDVISQEEISFVNNIHCLGQLHIPHHSTWLFDINNL